MIKITRLNGDKFVLNAILIEQIQAFPDTTITLSNNKKMVVKEPIDQVLKLTEEFYQKIGLISLTEKVTGDTE